MKRCPICGSGKVDCEFVDIGVGSQQCSPYACDDCCSIQVGPYDGPRPDAIVIRGWYVDPGYPGLEALRAATRKETPWTPTCG